MKAAKPWKSKLRRFIDRCRKNQPIPSRDSLSHDQEYQLRIIGGALVHWLEEYGPNFLMERSYLQPLLSIEPDPITVFTSNIPGMVVAEEVLERQQENIVYFFEEEYARWIARNPDESYSYHIHYWSYFTETIEDSLVVKARKAYPLKKGEVYWVHKEGTMWGKLCGRGGDHLWKWNGKEAVLLEEAIESWVA